MKRRKIAIICNASAALCWGILLYGGVYNGKTFNIIMYGICFVLSVISLIWNLVIINNENKQ